MRADSLEMTAALERHLNLRPIWTQVSLQQQVLEVPPADLELQLRKLCYQFKEGADLLHSAETLCCCPLLTCWHFCCHHSAVPAAITFPGDTV